MANDIGCCLCNESKSFITRYSRISVARTLMACLPRLFRTRSRVPIKKYPIAADIIVFGVNLSDFPFYIDNGILYVLI